MAYPKGHRHFAGLSGSSVVTVGLDESSFQFTDLSEALAYAPNGACIEVYPGTYSLTSTLAIDKSIHIKGIGTVAVNGGTTGIATALVSTAQPATSLGTVYITLENIAFTNAYTNTNCLSINNTGAGAQTMYINVINCSLAANGTGNGLAVAQSVNAALYVKVISDKLDSIGLSSLALTKAGSYVFIKGCLIGVSTLGTTDVASQYYFVENLYATGAITGGGAASILQNAWNNISYGSGAIAAQLVAEFAATAASTNVTTNTLL